MSVRRLPSGSYHARLMIDGATYAETFASERDAHDWETVTKARAMTGGLPKRITVRDYAACWMTTYDAAPNSTRAFHQRKLDRHILPAIGRRQLADVTPTNISRLLNDVRMWVSAAADRRRVPHRRVHVLPLRVASGLRQGVPSPVAAL
jgi:hypothetical protein